MALEQQGLSPRVRGSQRDLIVSPSAKGSIPAGAGEPWEYPGLDSPMKVYPRGCGGAEEPPTLQWLDKGLSPRVRGSPRELRGKVVRQGSIPAGAGEPRVVGIEEDGFWVYPRGCGGASIGTVSIGEGGGLSPRVRGSRYAHNQRLPVSGSIPAGAGEPLGSTALEILH